MVYIQISFSDFEGAELGLEFRNFERTRTRSHVHIYNIKTDVTLTCVKRK
jgi:hypothetical protein